MKIIVPFYGLIKEAGADEPLTGIKRSGRGALATTAGHVDSPVVTLPWNDRRERATINECVQATERHTPSGAYGGGRSLQIT